MQIHPEIIDEYVQIEIGQGNFLDPFSEHTGPKVHINHFGVIPKKYQPGKWHLITDQKELLLTRQLIQGCVH